MTTTNGRYPAAAVTTVRAVLTVPADLGGGSGAALAGEVLGRLRALELIAAGAPSSPATAARIRAELFEQTALWRRLLGEHCLAEDGDGCPRCRSWRGARRCWPCGVWLAAHTALVRYEISVRWTLTGEAAPALPLRVGARAPAGAVSPARPGLALVDEQGR